MSQDLWNKIWRDKRGRVVVYQRPNAWLIAWAIFDVISVVVPRGRTESIFWALGSVSLAIWAVWEIVRGADYFRRGLGLVVLLLTIGSALGLGL